MVLRYPTLFRLFQAPTSVPLSPSLSTLAADLTALRATSAGADVLADKLHRILLMTPRRSIPVNRFAHIAPDLGLAMDFRATLCPATPTSLPSCTPHMAMRSSSQTLRRHLHCRSRIFAVLPHPTASLTGHEDFPTSRSAGDSTSAARTGTTCCDSIAFLRYPRSSLLMRAPVLRRWSGGPALW